MIDVKQLRYAYHGSKKPALNDLTFTVQPGEIFGFLGPSGAGKSTTQKLLIGLLKGYSGSIRVLGRDLNTWHQDYYERVGVSFELPNHYLKLTARENLTYFRSLYQGPTEEPQKLLELVGLGNDADKQVARFSKGMSIRLNLARALIHRPALLFLDEPTSGLDPVNARHIKDLIRQKQLEGVTIFLTTHNMNVAEELCDRVAFLIDGEIKLIDTPRNLKLRYGRRFVRVEYRQEQREFPLEDLGHNAEFLDLLQREQLQTIHSQETTLENIFINVTGRSLT